MILTVTPNPSIDIFFASDSQLVWDDANRVANPRVRAGGQGINVTRAVRALGADSVAVALLGGSTGRELAAMLNGEGTPIVAVEGDDETRVFVAIREGPSRRSLLINPRGPDTSEGTVDALVDAATAAIRRHRPTWVVSSGSSPPGFPSDFHVRIGRAAREGGARFVSDCDGDGLRLAATSGICDLLAPNRHEALRLVGTDPADPIAAARVARGLLDHAATAAVKLGPLGAVGADPNGVWHARPPEEPTGVAVGAGDAFLAGLLLALDRGDDLPAALAAAVATGTSALHSDGPDLVDPPTLDRLLGAVRTSRVAEG